MKKQFQQRRCGEYNIKTDLGTHNFVTSSSHPISLDLHTYSYQEDFVRRHMHESNNQKNKNKNCEYYGNELLNCQKILTPSHKFYYQNNRKDKKNIYLSLQTAGSSLKPIDLDAISTSSDSGDEDNCYNKNSKNITTKHTFYSTSDMTTSDSEICRFPNIKNTKRY